MSEQSKEPRVVSVAVPSRLLRITEVDTFHLRIEQAYKDAAKKWQWRAVATVTGRTSWKEAHDTMHTMQGHLLDAMQRKSDAMAQLRSGL